MRTARLVLACVLAATAGCAPGIAESADPARNPASAAAEPARFTFTAAELSRPDPLLAPPDGGSAAAPAHQHGR